MSVSSSMHFATVGFCCQAGVFAQWDDECRRRSIHILSQTSYALSIETRFEVVGLASEKGLTRDPLGFAVIKAFNSLGKKVQIPQGA